MSNAGRALQAGREQAFQQVLDYLGHQEDETISVEKLLKRMPGVGAVLGVIITEGKVVESRKDEDVFRIVRLELSPDAYREIRLKVANMGEGSRVGPVDRLQIGPERIDLDGILLAREGDPVR